MHHMWSVSSNVLWWGATVNVHVQVATRFPNRNSPLRFRISFYWIPPKMLPRIWFTKRQAVPNVTAQIARQQFCIHTRLHSFTLIYTYHILHHLKSASTYVITSRPPLHWRLFSHALLDHDQSMQKLLWRQHFLSDHVTSLSSHAKTRQVRNTAEMGYIFFTL